MNKIKKRDIIVKDKRFLKKNNTLVDQKTGLIWNLSIKINIGKNITQLMLNEKKQEDSEWRIPTIWEVMSIFFSKEKSESTKTIWDVNYSGQENLIITSTLTANGDYLIGVNEDPLRHQVFEPIDIELDRVNMILVKGRNKKLDHLNKRKLETNFINNKEIIRVDKTTNLSWMTHSKPYHEAKTYKTWRIPTIQELLTIVTEQQKKSPFILSKIQTYKNGYVSSTKMDGQILMFLPNISQVTKDIQDDKSETLLVKGKSEALSIYDD